MSENRNPGEWHHQSGDSRRLKGERQVRGNFNQGKSSVNREKKWNWKSETSFTCHGGASQRERKNEAKLICVKLNFHFSLLSVFAFDCESGMFAEKLAKEAWKRQRRIAHLNWRVYISRWCRIPRKPPSKDETSHVGGKQTLKVQGALWVDVKTGLCGWVVQQGKAF